MHEIMQNSRDHVSCMQHLDVTYAFKKLKNLQLFENLNDAYYILMPMFATQLKIKLRWNELLCSKEIIVNRHFERKGCFSVASCKVL